jgi:glycosyltransferase involved in cell wall biosynthesis
VTRPIKVTTVGWGYDTDIETEEALLDRYTTLTGWSEALLSAGAARVTVVHRFARDAVVERNGVEYLFVRERDEARPAAWRLSSQTSCVVADTGADIVHVNGLSFPVQTWRLRQLLPRATALVVQDHATGVPEPPVAWRSRPRAVLRRHAMRAADGFLFTAMEQTDPWRRQGAIDDRQRVHAVLESSTSMTPLEPDLARRVTGVTGDPAVLWVGRLDANKDPLCALAGFARILADAPLASLTMVYGEDDLLPVVREQLGRSPGLAAHVRLVGRVPHAEMAAWYSAADIFLLASHHEGSGYALIEACACGAAPAVTRIPSFRAITGDGAIGCLWTAGDESDCGRALRTLCDRRGRHQRADVQRHFARTLSWDVVGARALAAYDDVIRNRRTRLRGARGTRRSDPA